MRMRVAEVSADRFEEELPVPEHVAEGANVTVVDKRPEYGKLILDAEKSAQHLAKIDQENEPGGEVQRVEVIVKPAKSDGA